MMEQDPLRSVLREWNSPEPGRAMDARVQAAYRESFQPSLWRRFWSARVSIPLPALAAPALAALVLMAAAFWTRQSAVQPHLAAPVAQGYMTRIESAGFQPLPDGATRVIRSKGVTQ